ncbi:MAG TPA: ComEC/Rec2 family competence protein [Patescibacteria group bacterium]
MAKMRLPFFLLLASCLLIIRFIIYFNSFPHYQNGQELKLQVVLMENPVLSNRGQRFTVKTETNQRIAIQTNLKELYQYGDSLAIRGTLQVQKDAFGRTFLRLYYPDISKQPAANNPLIKLASRLRQDSSALFNSVLPSTAANLLLGIVFGIKGDFPQDFRAALQSAGVLHVIAASGMNVSFFTGAVLFSLSTFLQRRFALVLAIFAAIFYSFLIGFEASIIRATIMAIIAFTASFLGRQMLSVLALVGTGYLMLVWTPAYCGIRVFSFRLWLR